MYILAGYNTLAEKYNELVHKINDSEVLRQLANTLDGNLQTFAIHPNQINRLTNTSSFKNYSNNVSKYISDLNVLANEFKKLVYIDSGGYQISIGDIKQEKFRQMLDAYAMFLDEHQHVYDRAFSLDMLPQTLEIPYDELLRLNQLGLYDHKPQLKKKLLKIFHFITPGCVSLYEKIFFNNSTIVDGHEKWSVGGLVAFDRSDGKLFTFPYALAFSHIYNLYKERYGKNAPLYSVEFHVLGVSSHVDVLLCKFLERASELLTNIKLTVTHDSSRVFKGVIRGKSIQYFNTKTFELVEVSYKSGDLDLPNQTLKMTNREALLYAFKEICGKEFDFSQIYENEKDPTSKPTSHKEVLIAMIDVAQFKKMKKILDRIFSNVKTYDELVSVTAQIFSYMTKSNSSKYNTNKLRFVERCFNSNIVESRNMLRVMFQGVNRLSYLHSTN